MRISILTTIFLSSVTFFSGCTSKDAIKPNKKLKKERMSVYNIIGINNSRFSENEPFIIKDDNSPRYNFTTDDIVPPERTISYDNTIAPVNSITYDDTITPNNIITPHQKRLNYVQNSISDNIEVVSYGSYNNRYQNSQNIINRIEAEAKSFLGTRYVWGATGPDKFDCSGFTQWVFRDAGINIPRVSRDQAKVGEYVSFNNLRKGDMIFFDTKKHKKGIVTHVGIYLGNGNFIHASSAAKKVVVFNFYKKPYYKERFLWGRRLVHNSIHYASNY